MIVAPDSLIASVVALGLSIHIVGGSIGNSTSSTTRLTLISRSTLLAMLSMLVRPFTSAVQFVRVLLTDPAKIATVPGVLSGIRRTVDWRVNG